MTAEIINYLAESLLILSAIANCSVSKLYLELCIAVLSGDTGNSSLRCQQINIRSICSLIFSVSLNKKLKTIKA